jgi:hypothetical protein
MILQNLTLNTWISYTEFIKPYEQAITDVYKLPICKRREVLINRAIVERAYQTYMFFEGTTTTVNDMLAYYATIEQQFKDMTKVVLKVDYELTPISTITFGQFIDAKQIVGSCQNRWMVIQYLISIFFSGEYQDMFCNEKSEQFQSAGQTLLGYGIAVGEWWEKFNDYINTNFTLFQQGATKGNNPNMQEHMKRWGWVNFLSSVAKAKVWDIAGIGKNSIDCARSASLFDVLTIASEEKDYNIAMSLDMEVT